MSKPPPPPPPKPSERKSSESSTKASGVKKLNHAILDKFETPGSELEIPGDKIKELKSDTQHDVDGNIKARRTTWTTPPSDAPKVVKVTRRMLSEESLFSAKLRAFEEQETSVNKATEESTFQSKLSVFNFKQQDSAREKNAVEVKLPGPGVVEERGKISRIEKPDRPPPPPPAKFAAKPQNVDTATNHTSPTQETADDEQMKNRPVAAPRKSIVNKDSDATKEQKPDRPLAPPPKPKRTFAHDIYMESKSVFKDQKAVDSNKNAVSGKIQNFEKSHLKASPPRPPPPHPVKWRASHPQSPIHKQPSSPNSYRMGSVTSDRSSASDYEYVVDWLDGRREYPVVEKRQFRPRSLSSEDVVIIRPRTVATEAPTSYEEPVYADPNIAMASKRIQPMEHIYAEPYESVRIHTDRGGVVNYDTTGYAVAETKEEFSRRKAQTMKPTGSAMFRSELQRRSSSLEGKQSPTMEDEEDGDKKKLPWIQRKINDAFMALKFKKPKPGDKKEKGVADSTVMAESMSQESTDSDVDTEKSEADHRRRLRHVKSVKETAIYCTLDKIRAGLRYQQIFDCIVCVELQKNETTQKYDPVVTYKYPQEVSGASNDRLPAIPQFCFPDAANWAPIRTDRVETFSFVLTSLDGSRTYGYCRRLMPVGIGLRLPVVYCILSPVGCFNLYDQILDEVERRRKVSSASVFTFLKAVSSRTMPRPGKFINVDVLGESTGVVLQRPMDSRLEHVDFGCILKFLSVKRVIEIFASIILERRIIFTAKKLSTLSGCIHAFGAMLYPFNWQHAYIPVLPIHLIEMCCLPTPYMIGLLSVCIPELDDLELDEALIVNLDNESFVRAVGDEHTILPKKLQMVLEKALTSIYRDNHRHLGDPNYDVSLRDQMVSETFVRLFVEMVGHYGNHLKTFPNASVRFQKEAFQKAHPSKSIRKFLEIFMETQMFSVFIQEKEMEQMQISPTQGTFDKRVQEYAEVSAVMPSNAFAKFGNRVRALGNKVVEVANAKLKK